MMYIEINMIIYLKLKIVFIKLRKKVIHKLFICVKKMNTVFICNICIYKIFNVFMFYFLNYPFILSIRASISSLEFMFVDPRGGASLGFENGGLPIGLYLGGPPPIVPMKLLNPGFV